MKRILKYFYIYCIFCFIVFLILLYTKNFYIPAARAQVEYGLFVRPPNFGSIFQYYPYALYPNNPWKQYFFPTISGNNFLFRSSTSTSNPISWQFLMPNSVPVLTLPLFFDSYDPFFPNSFNNFQPANPFNSFYQFLPYSSVPYMIPRNTNIAQNLLIPQNISPFPGPEESSEYPIPEDISPERKKALKKALDWIFENTTDLTGTTASEIGEEIMLFYQLYRRAQSREARDFCRKFIDFRIKQIVDSGKLNNPTPGETTVFLNVSEIMLKLGLSLFDHKSFINQKVLTNAEIFNPGFDIWNVSILERLGFNPPAPLISLMPNSSIAEEFQSGNLIHLLDYQSTDIILIRALFSDIIHEIFPLTDFGEVPIMMISPDQLAFLKYLIAKGIIYFIQVPDLDMVGELLICASMIGITDQSLLDVAYEFIIDNQIADGSFGETERFIEMGRSNASRHTVYVAVWAMIL